MNGMLDSVAIYNRALSDLEIGMLSEQPEFLVPSLDILSLSQSVFTQGEDVIAASLSVGGVVGATNKIRFTILDGLNRKWWMVDQAAPTIAGTATYSFLRSYLTPAQYTLDIGILDSATDAVIDSDTTNIWTTPGPFSNAKPANF